MIVHRAVDSLTFTIAKIINKMPPAMPNTTRHHFANNIESYQSCIDNALQALKSANARIFDLTIQLYDATSKSHISDVALVLLF